MKRINLLALVLLSSITFFSCKQQSLVVNPGAVVSKDGTDDGLKNVKREFNDVKQTDEGILVSISSDLLFPTNSSYLSDNAKQELSKLVKVLKDQKAKVRVDGHTDATGTAEYNQWLSDKRAASVKKFLVDAGIAESRLSIKGLGQSKPIADNKTPEGRQKNRRVEVVILK
ncbi:OmpA family protein [Sphingobacterium sp. DK4209]|uniref:OmpA family protein n=1 Tax=Sphingobacterium zhuxiongii TaxID=2662364 RepID=A0A5Q0QAL8_9SPHI|nr:MULTISPECIES: OmpA family protein [unclassified Sphingobacterium]MVZ67668.1 OmpA family protein [Sphingobacterium sp. DK4209]QGA26199.1 OmpA family protein [Sphingobacterium sp. dk4302]